MTSPTAVTRAQRQSSRPFEKLALCLLLSTTAGGLGSVAFPVVVQAQGTGVDALVNQAQYWRSKGREDLAQQALRRARAINPNHPALRTASAPAKPASAPKPASSPAPRVAQPKPSPSKAPAASRPAAAPKPAAVKTAPMSSADRAGRARVSGFESLEAGNLTTAGAQFQRALAVNRRDPDALGGLGLVRLREGSFTEAATLLEQASQIGRASQWAEGLAAARFFAGAEQTRALVSQNRLAEAQTMAEQLVRSGYKEPGPALELLADIYERQGRFADAADLYRQASQGAKEAGGDAENKRLQLRAARGRALAAAERGDDMGAIREFQSGIVLDGNDPWIRYEFAQFQIKRGRVPEAESLIRSLIANGTPDSLYAAALLNNDLDRASEAERLLTLIPQAQRTTPINNLAISVKTEAAIARARSLAATGRQSEALAALHQLGSMASIPVGKQASIANALFDLGDPSGALQVAEQAMSGRIENVEDYEGLVGVLARTGRPDLAQVALQRAGELAGSSSEGQRAYGRLSASVMISQADEARLAGRYAESFDILQQAYAAAPDNTEILSSLARLYSAGGMAANAAQSYQLVLARKAGDRDALLGLAESAQAAGDKELSRQAQRQALQMHGQDYRVYMALANVERARGNESAAVKMLKDARELYVRQNGSGVPMGANPFANATFGMASGVAGDTNPFRNRAAPVAPVNPFALGGGTRLPAAYPQHAASPVPFGIAGTPQVAFGAAHEAGTRTPFAAPYGSPSRGMTSQGAWGAPAVSTVPQSSGFAAGGSYDAPRVPIAYAGDPVMTQIQSEINKLGQEGGPRAEVNTSYRGRSGETGLSKLNEIKGTTKFSTGALHGRVFAKADATVIDGGRPTGSGLKRFGRNASPEARAIVDAVDATVCNPETVATCVVGADTQQASGIAFSAGYEGDLVQAEAGTTPIGMGKTKFVGRLALTPKIGNSMRLSAFAERKPVTDSVVSYAGTRSPTRDPVTGETMNGERWGQVMRTGAGLGLSYDSNGSGFYGEGRYYRFNGTNVPKNSGFESNVGGYIRAYHDAHSSLTLGLNVNSQSYDKSQNYFTFGNGGYFSPESFISVGFPVNYVRDDERWNIAASFTPGFQSYKEGKSDLYPTDPAAQMELNTLKSQDSDVRSYFDSLSKTGFALSAQSSLYYKVTGQTRVGGDVSYNTFGSYDELRSMIGVRQSFGSSGK